MVNHSMACDVAKDRLNVPGLRMRSYLGHEGRDPHRLCGACDVVDKPRGSLEASLHDSQTIQKPSPSRERMQDHF